MLTYPAVVSFVHIEHLAVNGHTTLAAYLQLGSGQDRRAISTAQLKGPVVGDNARGVRMRVVLYESEPRWEPPGRAILTDYGLAGG